MQDHDKHWESQEQGWDVSMERGNMEAGAWAMVMAHRYGTSACLLAESEHCVNRRRGEWMLG